MRSPRPDASAHSLRLGVTLTAVLTVAYFGFVGLSAFAPAILAKPVAAGGLVTWSFAYGLGVIVLGVVLTGLYVLAANGADARLTVVRPSRIALPAAILCVLALPAAAATGPQAPLNLTAIGLFLAFVLLTLWITWWAAKRTKSADNFYSRARAGASPASRTGWRSPATSWLHPGPPIAVPAFRE